MNEPTPEVGGRTWCPRCRKPFAVLVVIEKVEPWEHGTPADESDDILSTCPKCGGELVVLELSDRLRSTLDANRENP